MGREKHDNLNKTELRDVAFPPRRAAARCGARRTAAQVAPAHSDVCKKRRKTKTLLQTKFKTSAAWKPAPPFLRLQSRQGNKKTLRNLLNAQNEAAID